MGSSAVSQRRLASWISLGVSLALFGAKYLAYRLTGSQAVLSDAMESVVNVVAAGFALGIVHYAAQPADEDHPYGHGKAELFSATFEGGLILLAGILICVGAVQALVEGAALRKLDLGLAIVAGAGIANGALGLYLKGIGRKHHSAALEASGAHVLSDMWTTVGVLIGLGLVRITGYTWLDPVAAIAVGLQLSWNGLGVVRRAAGGLLDVEDRVLIERLGGLFTKHRFPGIIRVHHTRMIRSGSFHHVDAHLVVPEFWSVQKAHEETDRLERAVMGEYGANGEIAFHLDPCQRAYCSKCDLEPCPVRTRSFRSRIPFTMEELISPVELPAYRD
ncbi:MAG: cation transporter [Bdellovibrionales bacterium]|nr:cation transporter [Bdellovibrionales bacterium]